MWKQVAAAVIASLITAALFWIVASVGGFIETVSVPPGAVVAFHLKECPTIGWEEYTPAYGRFIRGIDRSKTDIDPGGEREPGIAQEDEFASHAHDERPGVGTRWFTVYKRDEGGTWGSEKYGNKRTSQTGEEGGDETRPKNVALLYCKKTR